MALLGDSLGSALQNEKGFVDVLHLCSYFIKITDCLVSVEVMKVLLMYINVLHFSALTNLMNKLLHFLFFSLTGSCWSNLKSCFRQFGACDKNNLSVLPLV